MKLTPTEISKSLNKAYLKQDLTREQMDTFKANLKVLFSKSEIAENKKEHEEHFKNIVSEFLKDTYYKNNFEININKRKDLVIHNGKSPSDSVGVIIEAKKPSNLAEMISAKTPNAKALHELLHYYMHERIINNNKEIKHLIATNTYDWYLFDASDFEQCFYENKTIRKSWEDWNNGVLVGSNTDWFYSEIAKTYIDKELAELPVVYFNLLDYKEIIENSSINDDDKLINLYKILSPEHLLKRPFANDSNTLNKAFYNELLHIIGLEEKPEGGKKLITRKKIESRDDASLLENTINKLKVDNCLANFDKPEQFGDKPEEQIYSLGLELCITWLNRILFLKLLEGQLVNYHNGNKDFSFMNIHSIADFDELNELFFEVLAEEYQNRSKTVNAKFGYIPYLNSSLFEKSEIEKKTFSISNLKDRLELGLYPHSVLFKKEENKQTTRKITLRYLMEFLSAYNFSSDSSAKIQEDNKNMINASVLGLIFEKINGYKDGSFFTPGFITMYMCRETIRKSVAQKFKELENKEIDTFEDVKNYTARYFKKEDVARFNKHIDSLKVCDPAVGSGHFLVSALNEIIAIKSELNILVDKEGTPLEYEVTVDNDELTILNKKTNKPFEYLLGADNKPPKALQQVQVSLFQEKQKIIENCLFGVDINPKSVLICRLRLWIELLKNAYYKFPSIGGVSEGWGGLELETLPNIDINIKCGNSLISRFPINSNLKQLAKTSKWTIFSYQNAVQSYKKSTDKNVKRDLEKLIKDIKSNYVNAIQQKNPTLQKYYKLKQEYDYKFPENGLFAHEPEQDYGGNKEKREDEKNRLANELKKVELELTEEKTFFEKHNAFEWRFEFPEVLNDDGDFLGFDVVIGNPPYYSISKIKHQADYFEKTGFQTYSKGTDIYCLFYEKGNQILNSFGLLTFITSNSWMRAIYGNLLKKYITQYMQPINLLNIEDIQVFDEATVESNIIILQKNKDNSPFYACNLSKDYIIGKSLSAYFKANNFEFKIPGTTEWIIGNEETGLLKLKIEKNSKLLKEFDIQINFGIKTGFNAAFIIDEETKNKLISEDPKSSKIIKPILRGRDLKKYSYEFSNQWVICTFPSLNIDIEKYQGIKKHFKNFGKSRLEQSGNNESRKKTNNMWFETQDSISYWKDFEKPKIIWGEISDKPKFAYDDSNIYAEATTFFMTGEKLKFLLAILNSNVSEWYFNKIGTTTGMGTNRWKKYKIELLPIKVPTEKVELQIIKLVDKIIIQKKQNLNTTKLEHQIDQLIYQLYNLTPEEIAIVEGN